YLQLYEANNLEDNSFEYMLYTGGMVRPMDRACLIEKAKGVFGTVPLPYRECRVTDVSDTALITNIPVGRGQARTHEVPGIVGMLCPMVGGSIIANYFLE